MCNVVHSVSVTWYYIRLENADMMFMDFAMALCSLVAEYRRLFSDRQIPKRGKCLLEMHSMVSQYGCGGIHAVHVCMYLYNRLGSNPYIYLRKKKNFSTFESESKNSRCAKVFTLNK